VLAAARRLRQRCASSYLRCGARVLRTPRRAAAAAPMQQDALSLRECCLRVVRAHLDALGALAAGARVLSERTLCATRARARSAVLCTVVDTTRSCVFASQHQGDVGDTGDDDVADLLRAATPGQLARVEDATLQGSVRGAGAQQDTPQLHPHPHASLTTSRPAPRSAAT
jgi:hypothetical protein